MTEEESNKPKPKSEVPQSIIDLLGEERAKDFRPIPIKVLPPVDCDDGTEPPKPPKKRK